MSTRRNLFNVGMASALIGQFGGFVAKAAAADGPLFKFGIIADPQYAPVAPNLSSNRYYANSLWKVSEAVATLNKEDLAFVVTLGDIIDRHWESFNHILPLYDDMKAKHFFLLGNHDYSVAPEFLNSVVRTAGMKAAHYDFTGGGYRFIVLDQNELAQFANAPGSANWRAAGELMARAVARNAPNAKPWNGAMSDQQYAWLDATLAKARASGEKAIVMGHYPIFPLALENNFLDDERLTEALVRHENVVAYLCGHHHPGNYGERGGKHFVNFTGMVDTATTSAFSVVEVFADRLNIRGTGREPNRLLRI
jgi:3',5'-cyclic AMP phosphodiesterase CpdA